MKKKPELLSLLLCFTCPWAFCQKAIVDSTDIMNNLSGYWYTEPEGGGYVTLPTKMYFSKDSIVVSDFGSGSITFSTCTSGNWSFHADTLIFKTNYTIVWSNNIGYFWPDSLANPGPVMDRPIFLLRTIDHDTLTVDWIFPISFLPGAILMDSKKSLMQRHYKRMDYLNMAKTGGQK